MVIDTSALLAILQNEPERRAFNLAIEAADSRLISAATFVEVSIVIYSRYGADGLQDLDRFLELAQVELAAVDPAQGRLARDAFIRFGKGRHPAALNFGDCFPYALSRSLGQSILYKGEDFPRTDIVSAYCAGAALESHRTTGRL